MITLAELVNRTVKTLDIPEVFDYASTQFQLPRNVFTLMQRFQKKVDDQDVVTPSFFDSGKVDDLHITLLWGITGGVVSKRKAEALLSGKSPIDVESGEVEVFEPNNDYDVVVVRVSGEGLHVLNSELKDAVPNQQTFPEYKPHMTVAYVKKGSGKKYRDLKFPKTKFVVDTVEYSTKNGKKTEIFLNG